MEEGREQQREVDDPQAVPQTTREEVVAAEGLRREIQDRSLALYDAQTIRERMLLGFDDVLALGFGCDLLARRIHDAIEYRLRVQTDSRGEKPVRTLQAIADRHNLTFIVQDEQGDHLELIFYPRV